MKLSELRPNISRKSRKRRGRGDASGHGGTSTRGHKGQKARAGGYHKRAFEGGQMPLVRRLPKRGFVNIFRKNWGVVNLEKLETLPERTLVTPDLMREKGWISGKIEAVKILGKGSLTKPMTVKAHGFSTAASQAIEKAGGQVEVLSGSST